jgi:hypothetical protein
VTYGHRVTGRRGKTIAACFTLQGNEHGEVEENADADAQGQREKQEVLM